MTNTGIGRVRESLQEKLEGKADEFFDLVHANFCVVHLICGELDEPGALRLSAVRAQNCDLAEYAEHALKQAQARADEDPERVSASDRELLHRGTGAAHVRALQAHVEKVDRRNTFLREIDVKADPGELNAWVEEDEGVDVYEIEPDGSRLHFRLGKLLIEKFSDVADEVKGLYFDPGSAVVVERLELARAELYGIKVSGKGLKFPELKKVWDELHALQSLVPFLRSADSRRVRARIRAKKFNQPGLGPVLQVWIAAPEVNEEKWEELNTDWTEVLAQLPEQEEAEHRKGRINLVLEDKVVAFSVNNLPKSALREYQKDSAADVVAWWAQLLPKLEEARHEGEALDMWFIAGDRSDFEDYPRTRVAPLDEDDLHALAVPEKAWRLKEIDYVRSGDGEKKRKELQDTLAGRVADATRLLEKEHYPWFKRGRHALFWDLTDASREPFALVSLRGLYWDAILRQVGRKAETDLDLPPCLIGFRSVVGAETGVVAVSPVDGGGRTPEVRHPRYERVLQLRRGRWLSVVDEWETQLKTELVNLRMNSDDAEGVAEICIRLSRDQSAGATIMILDDSNGESESKLTMGTAWRPLGMDLEDRLALMSHDGATVIPADRAPDRWQFRVLLIGEPTPESKALLAMSPETAPRYLLKSVGSRRWSAALAACNKDVTAVVVISQDGDIHLWPVTHGAKRGSKKAIANLCAVEWRRGQPDAIYHPARVGAD